MPLSLRILNRSTIRISISGLVVEYIVAIDVTRVRFPADAVFEADGRDGFESWFRCFDIITVLRSSVATLRCLQEIQARMQCTGERA